MDYDDFIQSKRITVTPSGFQVEPDAINPQLFPFQRDIVRWALRRGKAAIFADCGLGKGQPYGSRVLTPNGWVTIESLEPGDLLISSSGAPAKVIGVYPKQEQDTYRFYFSDGVSFVVDLDHLHICRTNNDRQRGRSWRVMSTKALLECGNLRYGKDGKSHNYDIPVVGDVTFTGSALPIHPYVLGVLLGDGYLQGNISISTTDEELRLRFSQLLPSGVTLKYKGGCDWTIKTGLTGTVRHPFRQALSDLGLLDKLSNDKHIPQSYLFSDTESRLELLRGLMDTDGYISPDGCCQFYSISKALADGVIHLVRSLGGIPTQSVKATTYKGMAHQPCHVVTFSLATHNPFYLPRKAQRWNPSPRDNGRWIDRIEYEGRQRTICIAVDSTDSSYVTEHFIVTHNTPMQLEWAQHVHMRTGGNVLILAPLAVSQQTAREGEKFGITIHICKTGADVKPGINIANYERLHHFQPDQFGGIVLDESSILKAQFGMMRHEITEFAKPIPYRLAASATPAPNDLIELINHAEFFGIMSEAEIKALFFTQDGNSSNTFRLRRHAEQDFWKWMASWSVALRKPSDLGYSDDGFILPPCHVNPITVDVDVFQAGTLFAVEAVGLAEQRAARRASLESRVAAAAELVNGNDEPWLVWCDLNDESAALAAAIPDAIEVTGSDSPEFKTAAMMGFSSGEHRVLISKASICGWGMNWQHCANVVFVGLSHSYEAYYQAVRRSWRFGQKQPVNVYIITSIADGQVTANIERKEQQAMDMFDQIVHHMAVNTDLGAQTVREEMEYREELAQGTDWQLYLGDSVKTIDHIESDSLGLCVFSPPFPGMYVYTNSPHDMGNVASIDQMIDQFSYLMGPEKLLRVLMPGRNVFIHITQGVAQKGRDGYIGLKDFRGKIIQMMQDHGWIYYGEAVIDKDPQLKAQRTKDHGLMFKSLVSDAARMHPALPDYLLQFKKPGENPIPIKAGQHLGNGGWVSNFEWILWARPVWYAADYMPGTWRPNYNGDGCDFGIRETDVLNVRQARETNDERHLCPLQIGVIERCVKVWSAPGDIVYSPFAGIGSEGYVALKEGRRFIGGELKESYWRNAIRNLESAIAERNQGMLFNLAAD